MARASVGDDVFGEDPSVNKLERRLAEMFGHEAGLFCPSGTMTNQIAINVHTRPGDEVICDKDSHVYKYEGGGIMANSGCSVKFVQGDRGRFTAAEVRSAMNPPNDPHLPLSRLVSIENTFNRGGGAIWELNALAEISAFCQQSGLGLHLDGARIFNALVATGIGSEQMGKMFDSVSICLSKGLGAPVGSVLVGGKEFIARAHRIRKRFGGGMRQAGIIAAGAIYALDNNIDRLADDHLRAQQLGHVLEQLPYVHEVVPVETNIVVFKVGGSELVRDYIARMKKEGILAIPFGEDMIRFVTHLDVSDADIERTITVLKGIS
jgi:threonine aldolase